MFLVLSWTHHTFHNDMALRPLTPHVGACRTRWVGNANASNLHQQSASHLMVVQIKGRQHTCARARANLLYSC